MRPRSDRARDAARPDPGFAAWVGGQHHQLVRSAYLLCGDRREATAAVDAALRELALVWGSEAADDAGVLVRRHAFGTLVARASDRPAVPVPDNRPPTIFDEEGEDRAARPRPVSGPDVWGALDGLTPVARAALVLRHLEGRGEPTVGRVLGVDPASLPDTVPSVLRGLDLAAELERAAGEGVVGEGDPAAHAWSARAERSRRRRRVLAVGAVAAVVAATVVTSVVLLRPDPPPVEEAFEPPVPTRGLTLDGTPYVISPTAGAEQVSDPGVPTGLPEEVDLGADATPLSTRAADDQGRLAVAAMVFLRDEQPGADGEAGVLRPVVVTPRGELVSVDTLDLVPAVDLSGNRVSPMSPSAVTADGLRVAFAQPDAVVVLDLGTGQVRRIPAPAEGIDEVGWTVGRVGLVASTDRQSWFVDGETLAVTALPERATPGHYRLVADSQGQRPMALQTWSGYGRQSAAPVPLGFTFRETAGDTVGSIEGRAATAVFVEPTVFGPLADERGLRDAIFVVQADVPSVRAILAFPTDGGGTRPVACCTPLAWADGSRLLYSSSSSQGTWIMLWDTIGATIDGVSRLRGAEALSYPGLALGRVG